MTNDTKPRTTKSVRMHLDIELRDPRDARELKNLRGVIEDEVKRLRSVSSCQVTQIIPAEANFDWQGE